MFLHVVAEFKTTVTQSTMLCNLPGMAFHVYCLVIPDAPPEYFIHQESSLPAKCLQQGQKLLSIAGSPSAYSIHQESSRSPSRRLQHFSFLHPAGSFSFPYHPLSLILELETHPSSLSLAHGQKPWHCTFLLRPAGRLCPPFQPSSLVYFHFVQMVSNHICRPLWSCHLWRKRSHL